jgi:hypothetical protein
MASRKDIIQSLADDLINENLDQVEILLGVLVNERFKNNC